MEGIADGFSVDSCYFCEWIAPNDEECPRCFKRMHYLPAGILDEDALIECLKAFKRKPSKEKASELAKKIWSFKKRGLPVEGQALPSLKTLRTWLLAE